MAARVDARDAADATNWRAGENQTMSESQMGNKIDSINAEQIELVSFKILDTVANRLGIDQKALRKAALTDVKNVVACSFAIPFDFIEKGFSFKLSTHEPAGVLADLVSKKKVLLDMARLPRNYRVGLDLDKKLTQQQNELVFVLQELSNSAEISQTTFSIKDMTVSSNL